MKKWRPGFTLMEMVILMATFSLLAAFTTINLIRPQTTSTTDATTDVLINDIKGQQIKSQVGDTNNTTSAQSFGIFFESNKYTLFAGTNYNPLDPTNFVVNLETNITITNITLPSSTLSFTKRSGEVAGFVSGSNSIGVQNSQTGITKNIQINRLGTVTVN